MASITRPSGAAGACVVWEVASPPEAPTCAWLGGPCHSAPQEWGTVDDDPPSWFKFQMYMLEETLRVL